ncbi:fused maltose transport subunit, ATP-binding component of ABC superfamily; regulatory protein [uncultured Pleomorphomonas sp.]|uniref:Fused maltose transport subunit, ATP-binding component of ABC superfamily regulatory protein n=1 Tax=uncultured Pleomorphomonas sp. TaxID=442121 RepID=A0A212LGV9_9HYPH|nr:sn-glycerol-3-phosphate ABC transporter ATP-binding protein UgpC [uncultured Pleomorphomonas sp.]SCM76803.1 fused maltose transport subunit, ATP-binding component of ABC superfamily; regulatory protein [uncultured Pleomorphomonas sp.]
MASVELVGVSKSYGAVNVIPNIDLTLDDGALTVFVGPSGCGKSTLLRMIAGLERISAGDVLIDGRRVNDATPTDRGIAMVFQNYALYPHMTVRQNVGFPLKMAGLSRSETDHRVEAAADSLQLSSLLDRKPAQLSGGQRQRVAIGRAIVRQPKVFLFDEPLSNLDAELRVQMRLEIARLHKQLAATMIYVTHDQIEAMTLADKIVVLRAGRVEQAGKPTELYHDPDNIFVAGFIGSPKMNFLKARVIGETEGGVHLTLPEFDDADIALSISGTRPAIGEEMRVGIRPEHFGERGDIVLRTEVEVVENLGGTAYAYARGAGGVVLTVGLADPQAISVGATFEVRFSSNRAFLFTEQGLRVR